MRGTLAPAMPVATSTHRLIFVNRFYRPDESATSQILSDLAEYLAASKIDTLVLTSRQTYRDAKSQLPRAEILGGVKVRRLPSLRFGRAKLIGRALDDLSFLLAVAGWILIFARAQDVVIAKTDPPLLAPAVALPALLRGTKVVNWLQDLFPEVAFATRLSVPGVLRGLLLATRNASLKHAAANVAIGELMASRLSTIAGAHKVRIVHNWAPFGVARPVKHAENPLRKQWGLGDRFVVGYSGNMGRAHEFETILHAAQRLRDRPDVVFLIIGGGTQRGSVEAAARDLGLGNVLFKAYQPVQRLVTSLSAADAHVVSLRPELESLVVPSKFYGAIAAGRPVIFIGDNDGEIARLVRDHGCGVTVRQGDAEGLAAAIIRLRETPDVYSRMAANALDAGTGRFGRERSLRQWKALLAEVTNQPA